MAQIIEVIGTANRNAVMTAASAALSGSPISVEQIGGYETIASSSYFTGEPIGLYGGIIRPTSDVGTGSFSPTPVWVELTGSAGAIHTTGSSVVVVVPDSDISFGSFTPTPVWVELTGSAGKIYSAGSSAASSQSLVPDSDISSGSFTPTPVWVELTGSAGTVYTTGSSNVYPTLSYDDFNVGIAAPSSFPTIIHGVNFDIVASKTGSIEASTLAALDVIIKAGSTDIASRTYTLTNNSQSFQFSLTPAEVSLVDLTDLSVYCAYTMSVNSASLEVTGSANQISVGITGSVTDSFEVGLSTPSPFANILSGINFDIIAGKTGSATSQTASSAILDTVVRSGGTDIASHSYALTIGSQSYQFSLSTAEMTSVDLADLSVYCAYSMSVTTSSLDVTGSAYQITAGITGSTGDSFEVGLPTPVPLPNDREVISVNVTTFKTGSLSDSSSVTLDVIIKNSNTNEDLVSRSFTLSNDSSTVYKTKLTAAEKKLVAWDSASVYCAYTMSVNSSSLNVEVSASQLEVDFYKSGIIEAPPEDAVIWRLTYGA